MLQFIVIDSFALIDHLEIEFESGLNLITGETGSGKSILVDAVGLLIGDRDHQELNSQECDTARIESSFLLE
jgi:DNA repair protein RecN (Recombination protein N)